MSTAKRQNIALKKYLPVGTLALQLEQEFDSLALFFDTIFELLGFISLILLIDTLIRLFGEVLDISLHSLGVVLFLSIAIDSRLKCSSDNLCLYKASLLKKKKNIYI